MKQGRRAFIGLMSAGLLSAAACAGHKATPTVPQSVQSSKADPVVIASIFSMSGEAEGDNMGAVAGVKFAVEEVNRNGGVLGRPLELVLLDNKSTNEGAREAAEAAVARKVVAIIGSSWSSHSLEVARIAQRSGIPMITNVSTHPDVTKVGDLIFRACFTDPYQGKVMADFAREKLSAKTAVVLVQDEGDYSIGLADNFSSSFQQGGGKILATRKYPLEEKNFSSLLDEVEQLQPDVMFIPGHHESARIIKQAEARGIKAKALGGDGWGTPGFYEEGGRDIHEAYFSTHWSKDDPSPETKAFLKVYGDSEVTIAPAALAQDAVGMLVRALESTKSTDAQILKGALAKTANYQGITGVITLDENRDPINKAAVIMTVRNGQELFHARVD